VTGVDSALKLEKMKQLGFDYVLDYRVTDFTKTGKKYDLIFDAKSTRLPKSIAPALKPEGKYVTVGGDLWCLFRIALRSVLGKNNMKVLSLKANQNVDELHKLIEKNILEPVIDGQYPLEKTVEAVELFGKGNHIGKVILQIDETD
jgi:NADPH:quinone reductase-like Zn-dependent oxidoreductase